MWEDEVLEEIYKIREEYAQAFNYDLEAICIELQKKQLESDRQLITQPLKQNKQKLNQSLNPTT